MQATQPNNVAKALKMFKFFTWISDTHFFSYQNYFKNAWDQFAVFHKSVKKKCKDNVLIMILKIYLNCCPDMEHCSPMFCCWNTVTEEEYDWTLILIHWITSKHKKCEASLRMTISSASLICTRQNLKHIYKCKKCIWKNNYYKDYQNRQCQLK